ncbi:MULTISPECIES: hypothetical protein [unclassified Sinorhizobium]|uniref:hypothetical protein n=1 Tax=unclassified Sinorhizobium TaxID=2613772 RepID=UPI0024C21C38|nr:MULTISPECIES: hypothetical protein [unclassified Sinorhizobium]MDK1376182.1 hypothetical protein [Sinorhizobium sp. 6-70]MDK1483035.1 hypothetical protein [Sinorhizobium sp. 6-117]
MTVISANSAALTILTQSTSFAQNASGNAADAILDIVSGRATTNSTTTDAVASATAKAKASEKVADAPRAVGGSVSSEISKATMSATSAAVVNSFNDDDPLIAFTPVKTSAENAEAFIRQAVWSLGQYNRRLEPDHTVLPRDEYNAKYAEWGTSRIANGEDAAKVNREVEYFTSDKMYQKEVHYAQTVNEGNRRMSEIGADGLSAARTRLSEIFGRDLKITYDGDGKAKIEAFELRYSNGQEMLSYGEDGSLATYNEDGSVRSKYTEKDVAQI